MSSTPKEIQITLIAGPPFVSIILNWGLFGVLSIQVYLYSQAFPNDRLWLKVFVWTIYLLEITQTFLLTNTAWNVFVSGFGNIEAMGEIGTTWLSMCIIGGLIGSLVQWFYAYRIAIISQKKIIPGFIIFTSLTSLAGAVFGAVNVKQTNGFRKLGEHNEIQAFTSIGLWTGACTICDVVIAVCMCYYLHRRKQYGRFSYTDALLSKLARMTIETGVLTATISTLSLILYYLSSLQDSSYFQVPLSAHPKFYSTTMLAVLNSRMKLGILSESTTWRDNELTFAPPHSRDAANHIELNNISKEYSLQNTTIHVTKEEIVTTDNPKGHYLAPVH